MRKIFGKRGDGDSDDLDELERFERQVEAEDAAARTSLGALADAADPIGTIERLLSAAADYDEAHREVVVFEVARLLNRDDPFSPGKLARVIRATAGLFVTAAPVVWSVRIASIVVSSLEELDPGTLNEPSEIDALAELRQALAELHVDERTAVIDRIDRLVGL